MGTSPNQSNEAGNLREAPDMLAVVMRQPDQKPLVRIVREKMKTVLAESDECDVLFDNRWHTLTVKGTKTSLEAYIDDTKWVSCDDLELPDTVYFSITVATGGTVVDRSLKTRMTEIHVLTAMSFGAVEIPENVRAYAVIYAESGKVLAIEPALSDHEKVYTVLDQDAYDKMYTAKLLRIDSNAFTPCYETITVFKE